MKLLEGKVAWPLVAGAALMGVWFVVDGPVGPGVGWLLLAAAGVVLNLRHRASGRQANAARGPGGEPAAPEGPT